MADTPKCGCLGTSSIMHGLIIILLLFIIWKLTIVERATDGYIGSGVQDQVFTSGATMRRLGQVFSSTDQGTSSYVSNDEIKAAQRFP